MTKLTKEQILSILESEDFKRAISREDIEFSTNYFDTTLPDLINVMKDYEVKKV